MTKSSDRAWNWCEKSFTTNETLSLFCCRPAGRSPCRYTESIVHVYKISVHMHDYNLTKSSLGQIKSCNGASCAAHGSGSLCFIYGPPGTDRNVATLGAVLGIVYAYSGCIISCIAMSYIIMRLKCRTMSWYCWYLLAKISYLMVTAQSIVSG